MIGIINYGAGNIFSLTATLARLGIDYGMVNTAEEIDRYERIIIPGVGHAGAAMEKLKESGLAEHIAAITKPVLGICVGMQLMTAFSEEGQADLLGLFPMKTLDFSGRISLKVPHVGWNAITPQQGCPLFKGIEAGAYFYFVHSYFIEYDAAYTAAVCEYELTYSAAIHRDNFYGVQFHPEKSGPVGEQLLLNFSTL